MDLNNYLYICNNCNFKTNKKCNYKRHLNTKKHIIKTKQKKQNNLFLCETCKNKFKSRTSLWRHIKLCKKQLLNNNINYKNNYLINNQNYKYCINININNLNIFLNNECKDALSIQEFTNKIYYLSIKNINDINNIIHKSKFNDYLLDLIINNIKPLSLTERPIHYKMNLNKINNYISDSVINHINKNEWFIKDKTNGWKEDDGNIIINSIKFGIQKNWIKEFEHIFPNWKNNDNLQNIYIQLVSYITSDIPNKNKIKILKELSEYVTLNLSNY